ncbi:MAG: hypothetical protein BWK77_01400 [Verrucomicrobia bacterium A1]|nr:MAG: hypothetical protein BWK77_01400 [Verrucomicrobia bacterium A1]
MNPERNHIALLAAALLAVGCSTQGRLAREIPESRRASPEVMVLEATAYCPCGDCCGWRRNWLLRPVIASGPNRGRRKAVGITATGTEARPGTVAADPRMLPFGTILYVPGYGYGRVEDTGGDIKGNRIDLFYPSHAEALDWGRHKVRCKVWRPLRR